VGQRGCWRNAQRVAEDRAGFVGQAAFEQRIAEVDARFDECRGGGNGATEAIDGIIRMAQAFQYQAEMV
jgi:hypothetical protein